MPCWRFFRFGVAKQLRSPGRIDRAAPASVIGGLARLVFDPANGVTPTARHARGDRQTSVP
jgi:hypothetical protein